MRKVKCEPQDLYHFSFYKEDVKSVSVGSSFKCNLVEHLMFSLFTEVKDNSAAVTTKKKPPAMTLAFSISNAKFNVKLLLE